MKLETILNPIRLMEDIPNPLNTKGFSLNRLATIQNHDKRIAYARDSLQLIGEGSSRVVFFYKGMALKIAKNSKGIAQNALEAQMVDEDSDVLVEIYKVGPGNVYLLTEIVQPNPSHKKIETIAGIRNYDEFDSFINDWYSTFKHKESEVGWEEMSQEVFDTKWGGSTGKDLESNPWVKEVLRIMDKYDLIAGDIHPDNLGIAKRDGTYQVVILDPGYNSQVAHDEYTFLYPRSPLMRYKTHE